MRRRLVHLTHRYQRGFTLSELILVILVLGILSFVAVTRLNDREQVNAQGFAEQIAVALRWAQKSAVAQRRTVYVNLNPGNGRVHACFDAVPACNQPVAAPFGGALDIAAPSRITFSSSVTQFSFDPLGRPSIVADLEIRTSTQSGINFVIQVERESGYVRRV